MKRITQTKENRDAVRAGKLIPELYGFIERAYRRHGLPGLAIAIHNREDVLLGELDDIEDKVAQQEGMTRLLLAFRIQQDGHAKSLGAAADIAANRGRVRELYPDLFD
jgi:hypothetical protein